MCKESEALDERCRATKTLGKVIADFPHSFRQAVSLALTAPLPDSVGELISRLNRLH